MKDTPNIEIWNPEKIFCELSKNCDLVVFYLSLTAESKGFQLKSLAKDLDLSTASIDKLLKDTSSIAVYAGSALDVNSLVVILSAYPYNELVYFAHYSLGILVDENVPTDLQEVAGEKGE